ncbi:hypothetical protein EfmJHP9_31730 (plasmid) [Enterococcus faecium]|nr:hypothetical protein EfmJHP9_31730 [Enterococcus faecium]
MKKIDLINMIGMLIGILVNIVIFTDWLGCYFSNLRHLWNYTFNIRTF